MDKLPIKTTLLITAVAILAYFIYTLWIGWEDTLNAISSLGIVGWVLVLSLSVVNYILRFIRWQWYLGTTTVENLSLSLSLRYYLVGFAFTTTPGKVGEMVRSLFLRTHNVRLAHSLAMYFIERLSDLFAMLLLALLLLVYFTKYILWLFPPLLIAVVVLLLLQYPYLLHRLLYIMGSYLPPRLQFVGQRFNCLLIHARVLLSFKFLYGGLLLSLVAWAAEGVGFYLILYYLDLDIHIMLAIGIYAMSIIIGVASFMPGGLGGTEAAMLIFLLNLGVSPEVALAATLICRFATLWFAVILGAIAMLGLNFRILTNK